MGYKTIQHVSPFQILSYLVQWKQSYGSSKVEDFLRMFSKNRNLKKKTRMFSKNRNFKNLEAEILIYVPFKHQMFLQIRTFTSLK